MLIYKNPFWVATLVKPKKGLAYAHDNWLVTLLFLNRKAKCQI